VHGGSTWRGPTDDIRPYSKLGFDGYIMRHANPYWEGGSDAVGGLLSSYAVVQKGGVTMLITVQASGGGTHLTRQEGLPVKYIVTHTDKPWIEANLKKAMQEATAIVDSMQIMPFAGGKPPELNGPENPGDPPVVGEGETGEPPPDGTAKADGLWREADDAYQNGDLATAEQKANESVALVPKKERADFAANLTKANQLWKEGRALYDAKNLTAALAKFKESVTLAASKPRLQFVAELEKSLTSGKLGEPPPKTTGTSGGGRISVRPAAILGTWNADCNGHRGSLVLNESANGLAGKIYGEMLRDISYDPATATLRFLRPGCAQLYTGVLLNGAFEGTFTQDGRGNYKWKAWREGGPPSDGPGAAGPPGGGATTVPP
jgi:hypothetical protein